MLTMYVCVWGGGIHQRTLMGEQKGKANAKKREKVLSVDVEDHFERRRLIFFEIARARPTAMLGSLSILRWGYCQCWDPFLCLLSFFPCVCLPVGMVGWRWGEGIRGKVVRSEENLMRVIEQVGKTSQTDYIEHSKLNILIKLDNWKTEKPIPQFKYDICCKRTVT